MKKRLIFSILSTVLISLILVSVLFISIVNYEYEENIRETLKDNNQKVINLITTKNIIDLTLFFNENYKDTNIRVTYVDKNGHVLYDTDADPEEMNNHNTRPEIIEARKSGNGTSKRFSVTVKKYMMYYATAFGDGYIIRSSMPMRAISGFEQQYIKYYIGILVLVFIISATISLRLIYFMLKPIKELEFATEEIAKGDLNKRALITSNDEIGHLGKTFNDMADKLQLTIKDAIDKQNRLEAILKSMESGIIAVDKSKRIIMINPYAEKIFGICCDVIGQNLMDIIRNYEFEDVFINSHIDAREIKTVWPRERILRVRTADLISQEDEIGTVAVIQDVTDMRKLENMRSQFVANVSHELKTPLTSIKGFAETLKDVEDQQLREKFLNIINDEAERLTRLINDILTLSDIEQHVVDKHENVNVKSAINDVYYLMKNTAEDKNIELSLKVNSEIIIIGDNDRFKQMLINLVDNAIKYSEAGDKVIIENYLEDNQCVLSVEDTGPGISEKHLPRLFERFYRVDKARSRAKGGTGLGLAIVKHIVLSFEGTIEVQSTLGKGSKFIIKIPAKVQ